MESQTQHSRYPDITGVVLVGGQSRRMGRDKAFLPLSGRPIFERILEAFNACFFRTLLAGKGEERFAPYGLSVLPDIYPGSPLGGIYTGLYQAATPYVFVSSCDIPFPNPEVIRNLCSRRLGADAVVVQMPQGCEPLFALYSKACLGPIRRHLEKGDCCAYGYYPEIRVRYVQHRDIVRFDPEGRSFLNVNTPQEFQQIGGVPWT